MTANYIFLNGGVFHKNEALVSPFDRGFQYGESVYEVVPVFRSELCFFEKSWKRLCASAKMLSINLTEPKSYFLKKAEDLVRLNELDVGFMYIQVSQGVSHSRHKVDPSSKNTVFMYCGYHDFINKMSEYRCLDIVTVEESRWRYRSVKCCNLIPNAMAKQCAYSEDADEALFVYNGLVNEGASSSLFWIKDQFLFVRKHDEDVLPGIRADVVSVLAKELGLIIEVGVYKLSSVKEADEVFLTSATLGVAPVRSIDNQLIGEGSVGTWTKKIVDSYLQCLISGNKAENI